MGLCGIVACELECGVVCDSHFVVCFRFHFFDLGTTGGCLLAVPAWGGVAVLAHTLKQVHYERQ